MANPEHISILGKGVEHWNLWRKSNPDIRPDLSGFDFTGIQPVRFEDSSGNSHQSQLWRIDLKGANLQRALLSKQEFFEADLSNSDLQNASLNDAIIKFSDLRGANLRQANLKGARLINADLRGSDLTGASIFGISPWNVKLENSIQKNLLITPSHSPEITVDNIEAAQSIHSLFYEHKKIRDVLKTIGERAILLLGRFTKDRKETLEAVAEKLRELRYLPIIFDFEPISTRNYTETVVTLAGLSKFIIADITLPKSVPQETQAIIPVFQIPFISIIQKGEQPWSMFADFENRDWVIGPISYPNKQKLIENLKNLVDLAEKKNESLAERKAKKAPEIMSIEELNGAG